MKMKLKTTILTLVMVLALLILAACSASNDINCNSSVPSQSESTPPSPSSISPSEPKPSSSSVPQSSSASSKSEAPAISSSAPSSAPEPIAPIINITVQPVSMTGEHKAFSITDNNEQDLILGYFAKMQPCNPDPHMGGYVFDMSITNNGVTEKLNLLSATDTAGNSYVVKNDQWYTADHKLWLSVAAYYPKFDYENNQPDYSLEIMSKPKNSGAGLAFYSNPLLVWSEAEQEKAANILAYVSALQPVDGNMNVADTEKNIVEIYIYENDIEQKYICYDLYDQNGKCIVKYEGERIVEKGWTELPPYKKGGWFVADAGFYNYLDSLV